MKSLLAVAALLSLGLSAGAQEAPKPLRVLLITGGCCHDYAQQKDILKAGLEQRINVTIDQLHTGDRTTKPPLPILGNPDYAKGYDLVIHDECAADISDPALVEAVLKPHRDGIPGVNLHCAMHSFRTADPAAPQQAGTPGALWFEYLGLQSSGHGAQLPIAVSAVGPVNPIVQSIDGWQTGNEELYNNIQIFPTATPLARGRQTSRNKEGKEETTETVVAWTNRYGATRVFSTTLGHSNETVADPRYLDLVARGVLWAGDKLQDDGTSKPGYGPRK